MNIVKVIIVLGFIGVLIGSALAFNVAKTDNVKRGSKVPSQIESITPLDIDSIKSITIYAIGEENAFVTMVNDTEHYCTVRTATRLRAAKVGNTDTKFDVWTNNDGETEIVVHE